jgi:hypothetical protein
MDARRRHGQKRGFFIKSRQNLEGNYRIKDILSKQKGPGRSPFFPRAGIL